MNVGAISAAGALLFASAASAAEIKVLSTQATEHAYRELVPAFEQATGYKGTTVFTGAPKPPSRNAAWNRRRTCYGCNQRA